MTPRLTATPAWPSGDPRPWQIAICSHEDRTLADPVLAELRREAARVPEDRSRLYEIARRLPDLRPPADTASIVDWASHAHAELFVAAGQIDAERERVIREANELASMLVGEPTYGATVAQALARAEAHCVSSPGHVSESR